MHDNLLFAVFVLLLSVVALVPLAKLAGLGSILGYLIAGVLVGPYGFGLIADSDIIHYIADFGIVMMLFLIGLDLNPRELWRMRHQVMGLGLTQFVATAILIGGAAMWLGAGWQVATILGLGLAMSSTAVALQTVEQRGILPTDAGRAALAVLLVQDVAVIPVLAAIPLLAAGANIGDEVAELANWRTAAEIIGAVAVTILAGRFLVRPVMRFVAEVAVREAFTALALMLVVGAALLMQAIGLSPALGAFLAGLLLADSEYRHEIESDLAPFKGLLLGLFFISVGMSIAFSAVLANPVLILTMVLGLVALKFLVLIVLTTLFRMHLADRMLVAILLCQGGEFGFVLFGFAQSAGVLPAAEVELLYVVIALSMALTPLLLLAFDKLIVPRLSSPAKKPDHGEIDVRQKVIVLGYGRFGQIVTRLMRAQGFEMTLIDDDPAQIETVKRFGVKVFYGDGGRLDLLHAAGAEEAELIIIAVANRDRILAIGNMIKRNFPHVKVAARAVDRTHALDLMDAGIEVIERELFHSAIALGVQSLVALGYKETQAARLGRAFARYDERLLRESRALRHDEDAYVGFMRQSLETLKDVMEADLRETQPEDSQRDTSATAEDQNAK